MKNGHFKFLFKLSLSITVVICSILFFYEIIHTPEIALPKRIRSTSSSKVSITMKKVRWNYFFRMLRDPVTNQIPINIRQRELIYARTLKRTTQTVDTLFIWSEAGPIDLGGRTRALAVDITNSEVIIAGGVSGGIWKSIDNGITWILKSDPSQNLSITSLAQDPRPNHTDTWYYATGEFVGNSASDLGFRSPFYGVGLYKSTDNGETWRMLPNPWRNNPTSWDNAFDFVSRIAVSPITGDIFVASHGVGIFRSDNNGKTFELVLGEVNDHSYTDVVIASDGTVITTLSQFGYNSNPVNSPGVYKSTNNGLNWINITPGSFPSSHERSILASAPSNPEIVYLLTFTGEINENGRDDVRFHKINVSTGESEDRSANLPDFGNEGFIHTQLNYNMVVAVKPDDENFVLIGATSLFRSKNGFETKSQDIYNTWIGGYEPARSPNYYPDLHPDQHVIVFDPLDPNKAWVGHDGGISFTSDITASSSSTHYFPWENKNNGYNVTQFYTVTIPDGREDNRIMGGTQDNGTPYFTWNGIETSSSKDISSGDGASAYFGEEFAYASTYNGRVLRLKYDPSGNPSYSSGWTTITPIGARDQLFINPFVVDPNDEDVMYYPAGNTLWRNDHLSDIPKNQDSTSHGWTELTDLRVPPGYIISTLAVSRYNPTHLLYYGASSWTDPPKIYRLEEAHRASKDAQDMSIPEAPGGAYLHSITINPNDGNEILVILSNYNITGLYHSTNGGESYMAVEGNLEGNTINPGPSIRSGTILPTTHGTIYIIGTSTGLYSTKDLDGSNTVWKHESENEIGNVVVAYVTSRTSDGRVAVGTHGRGVFIGNPSPNTYEQLPQIFSLNQNYPNPFNRTTTISYELPKPSDINLSIFNLQGHLVETLVSGQKNAGSHSVQWKTKNIASGLYLYRISAESFGEAGEFTETKKCLLVK